jgi:DNA repair exonuclease SbcCD nuclease subunit
MSTLVIGDLHFVQTPHGLLEAQLSTIKKLLYKGSEEHGCSEVIFLGDLMMHRTPRPPVLLALRELLKYATELGYEAYILRGNHDSFTKADDGVTALSLFSSDKVHIYTQTTHDTQKKWTFIPHYENEERITQDLGNTPPGHIVFGHFGCHGSLNSTGDADFGIPMDAFSNRTILGHIHKAKESGKVTILGTPYSTNFGEAGKDCFYGVIDDEGEFSKYPIDFGIRHLVMEYDKVADNADWVSDLDWFTLLRVNINSLEEDSTIAWTCDSLDVGFFEIKYVPLIEDRDEFTPVPGVASLQINDDLIDKYINASQSKINKSQLLEGLKRIHENQESKDN